MEEAAPWRTVKILQWAKTGACSDGCSPRIPKMCAPPKLPYLFTSPHGVTSQKTNFHEQRRENPKRFLSIDRGTVGAALSLSLSLSFNLYSDPSKGRLDVVTWQSLRLAGLSPSPDRTVTELRSIQLYSLWRRVQILAPNRAVAFQQWGFSHFKAVRRSIGVSWMSARSMTDRGHCGKTREGRLESYPPLRSALSDIVNFLSCKANGVAWYE